MSLKSAASRVENGIIHGLAARPCGVLYQLDLPQITIYSIPPLLSCQPPVDVDERRDTWQNYVNPRSDIPYCVSYLSEP